MFARKSRAAVEIDSLRPLQSDVFAQPPPIADLAMRNSRIMNQNRTVEIPGLFRCISYVRKSGAKMSSQVEPRARARLGACSGVPADEAHRRGGVAPQGAVSARLVQAEATESLIQPSPPGRPAPRPQAGR